MQKQVIFWILIKGDEDDPKVYKMKIVLDLRPRNDVKGRCMKIKVSLCK